MKTEFNTFTRKTNQCKDLTWGFCRFTQYFCLSTDSRSSGKTQRSEDRGLVSTTDYQILILNKSFNINMPWFSPQ